MTERAKRIYRIKKTTKDDVVGFRAQRKYLWWWIDLGDYDYSHYESVFHDISKDIQKRTKKRAKTMIEYLDVTPEKLAQDPTNPPVDAL
jgi:hypothetical protein